MGEMAIANEIFGIKARLIAQERASVEDGTLIVRKYDGDMANWITRKDGITAPKEADFQRHKITPYQTVIAIGNGLTQQGWGRMLNLTLAAGATQAYDVTHSRIGVSTGTAATATGDTELNAASGATGSRFWKAVDSVGTTGTGTGTARLSFVGTVGSADANFAWQDWAIDQGGTATATSTTSGAAVAPLLNHKVQSLGTKASPAVWTATAQLDFT